MKIEVPKNWILVFLLTLPHLKPSSLELIHSWDLIFNVWRIASLVIVVGLYAINKYHASKITYVIFVMEAYILLNTYIQHQDTYSCLKSVYSVISMVLIYEAFGKDKKIFIGAQLACYELLIYINLISEILYPKGMYRTTTQKNWFLGYYNSHIIYFVPGIIFALLYAIEVGSMLRAILLIGAIIVSAIRVWSGGSIITIAVVLLTYVFLCNYTMIFNYYTYWLIQPVFFIVVMVNKRVDLFRWLIGDALGKWESIRGRMIVWNIELNNLSKYLLFGNGIEYKSDRIKSYLGMRWAVHAHNLVLELLHQGGLIYLMFLIVIILMAGHKLSENRNSLYVKILSIGFLGWSIRCTVDPCFYAMWIALFVLAYKCNAKAEESESIYDNTPKVVICLK